MKTVKFVRGSDVKYTHDIYEGALAALGWTLADAPAKAEKEAEGDLSRAELEAKAKELGIEFSPRIGDEKLKERIDEALKAKAA